MMDEAVVKVYRVAKGSRPVLCQEARAVQEGPHLDPKFVVIYFHGTILRGAVRSGRFECVTVVPKQHLLKSVAPSEFSTLICSDQTAVNVTMQPQKSRDEVQRWVFARG